MNIIWYGQSCFQIIANRSKNGQILIVIDPFSEDIGLRVPKLEADILLVTHKHSDHNNIKAVSGTSSGEGKQTPFLIDGAGEYEIKEVYVQGISAWHDESGGKDRGEVTIYIIEIEGLRICHLGDMGQKELSDDQLEQIGDVDILMIPVGGGPTISAKEAVKIISQIEPKITIPMHYQIPKLTLRRSSGLKAEASKINRAHKNLCAPVKLDGVDKFLKALGLKSVTPEAKLTIKEKDLSSEEAKIIILKP